MNEARRQFELWVPPDLRAQALQESECDTHNPDRLNPLEYAKEHLLRTRDEMMGAMADYYTD